jgi:hypothetical protein
MAADSLFFPRMNRMMDTRAIVRATTECEELEVHAMPFKRRDIESLHNLVQSALEELPEELRPSPREQRMTASEYGHWARRVPRYAMVNIGVQRAANPSG